jgi:hypothetical protein
MFKSEEAIWSSNDCNHLLMASAPNGGTGPEPLGVSHRCISHVNCMVALVPQFELFSLSLAQLMEPIKRDISQVDEPDGVSASEPITNLEPQPSS